MGRTTFTMPLLLAATMLCFGLRQARSGEPADPVENPTRLIEQTSSQAPAKSTDGNLPAVAVPRGMSPFGQPAGAPASNLQAPGGQTPAPAGPATMDPFRPSRSVEGAVPPVTMGSLNSASPWGAMPGQQAVMPVMPMTPFAAAPRGAASTYRAAAVYGMQPGPVPAVGGRKPFANFRPQAAVSPFMGLYAPSTPGVNNYNAYVRPQLEQQAFNEQVDRGFRTIEQREDAALQTSGTPVGGSFGIPNQLFQTGPGLSSATFMNLQPYYPNRGGARP